MALKVPCALVTRLRERRGIASVVSASQQLLSFRIRRRRTLTKTFTEKRCF